MARLSDRLRTRAALPASIATVVTQSWTSSVPGNEKIDSGAWLSYVQNGYKSNGIVFAVVGARLHLFSEAQPRILDTSTGRLLPLDARTDVLTHPWPNGSSGELLARMEQDVSMSGNAFILRRDRLIRLRPDYVELVVLPGDDGHPEVQGYLWSPNGVVDQTSEFYEVADVAHYSPIPDPEAQYRGMSWLTPVVREVNADIAMTTHKIAFFENSATPNLLIKYQQKLNPKTLADLSARFAARHEGAANAWRTAVLDEGADLTVVGHSMEQMTFTALQAAGEARVAAAGGVPAEVVGLGTGDYDKAMKRFADLTMRPLWHSAAAALTKFVDLDPGEMLVLDASDVAAMQDGEQERAETFRVQAVTAGELIRSGYEPDTVAKAIQMYDLSVLKHTGGVPTALYPEGQMPDAGEKKPSKDSPLVQGYKGDGKSG
jgi:phage portal protein BeeE